MLRLLNLLAVIVLVVAAAVVYKIKYESTLAASQAAKLRTDIARERDRIAALRAEWSRLDNPERIQELATRHLTLKPLDITQYDALDRLPERPIEIVPPGTTDPIGAIIESQADEDLLTGSATPPAQPR